MLRKRQKHNESEEESDNTSDHDTENAESGSEEDDGDIDAEMLEELKQGGRKQHEEGTVLKIIKPPKGGKHEIKKKPKKLRIDNTIVKKFSLSAGKPIAHILKKDGTVGKESVYLAIDKEGDVPYIDSPYKMFPYFYVPPNQSLCIFVSGKKGSGKSTFGNRIVKEIIQRKKKNVYLISPHERDASIDQDIEKIIKRLEPEQYQIELLKDSIVIFDDIDTFSDQKLVKKLYILVNNCVQSGRKYGIDVIFINHTLRNNMRTKYVIQECDYIVVFPGTGNDSQIESFIKAYVGLDVATTDRILNTNNSDWVVISTAAPGYILTQHELYIPSSKKRRTQTKYYK